MILCPFCHYNNEDGALFCEQCKSDLSGVPETPSASPMPVAAVPIEALPIEAMPIEAMPIEAMPVEMLPIEAMPIEAEPIGAIPIMAEAIPAEPIAAMPYEAVPVAPVEAMPLALELEPPPPPKVEAPPPPPPAPEPPKVEAPPPPPPPAPEPPKVQAPTTGGDTFPTGAEPRLLVVRGQKRNVEFPVYQGDNFIGRADEKPVDIDLEDQEPPDRVWCSRQHALVSFEDSKMFLEDLNSANGTYLNRARVYPGQRQALKVNDVIQIGNVQLKVII